MIERENTPMTTSSDVIAGLELAQSQVERYVSLHKRIIMDECRKQFEAFITAPPFERKIKRNGPMSEWPGTYNDYPVELAWCAWQAAWNRRAEQVPEWQPIETAPKELGKRILGLKDCGEGTLTSISIVFWLNDGEWHINDCAPRTAEGFGYRVTHWMPLPAAPEVKP